MKKLTLITIILSVFAITNAQVDENNSFNSTLVPKKELIMPQRLIDMAIAKLKNEPAEKYYRYGVKSKEQFENLQLGRPLREFRINMGSDTLTTTGSWQVPVMYNGKALFLAYVTGRDAWFGSPTMGESIHHYERKDLVGILRVQALPTADYLYILREEKDVFLQVLDIPTRQYFKNEYSLSELISLRNRAIEVRANPTKEGYEEIYGRNAPVDENDIFDTRFPQKHELKLTPEITEILTAEIYWSFIDYPDSELFNYGITNRAQLENLHLGKPIPKYRIDIDNENLIFIGGWEAIVLSNEEPLFIIDVGKGEEQYWYTGSGRAGLAKILHNYEHKDLIIGYFEFDREKSFYTIRKGHQVVFVQVYDYTTHKSLRNEYSFSEIINLIKK